MSSEKVVPNKAIRRALKIMKDAGFEISDSLKVFVDPKLSFMGYSTKRDGGDVIVISGRALASSVVEGLLVHEMSHIYRINTNHPSHNHELLNRVEKSVLEKSHLTKDYQIAVIQQAINHVQDLYADDVAFRAFSLSGSFTLDEAFNFFLTWINDKPLDSRSVKSVWLNIGILVDNCFALSNMIRHGVPDVNDQAENKAQKFLSQTNSRMKEGFAYLKDFMTNLKENPTEKEFEENLTDYLMKIVELAN
ncbi:MAG: DUF5781 family protein [Candidatus Bathyarchaeia archaeon]